MKLYLLRQEVDDCSEGSDFHYNSLLNYPGMILLDTVEEFPFDGFFFQNVTTINQNTSCIYDEDHYRPHSLLLNVRSSDQYLFLNNSPKFALYSEVASSFVKVTCFVKPNTILKGFTPTMLKAGDRFAALNLTVDQELAIYPFKNIHGSIEYCCVFVDNRLVSIVNTEDDSVVPPAAYLFAEKISYPFEEIGTYVLDILYWRDMYFVVEINPLETSGFFENYEVVLNALSNVKG